VISRCGDGTTTKPTTQAASDDIGRISITLKVDNEEPLEAEMDLLPDEDPILIAQRLVTGLFRLRAADAKSRS